MFYSSFPFSGSYNQSPEQLDAYPSWNDTPAPCWTEDGVEETLKENLADAMLEGEIQTGGPTTARQGKTKHIEEGSRLDPKEGKSNHRMTIGPD